MPSKDGEPMNLPCTDYFRDDVLPKRPYLQEAVLAGILASPLRKEMQPCGRIRHWGYDAASGKYLRVVTLADGRTVHNAFYDRRFKP